MEAGREGRRLWSGSRWVRKEVVEWEWVWIRHIDEQSVYTVVYFGVTSGHLRY